MRGIDLRIRATRVFQVSGKITLPPGAPPGMMIPLMLFNEGMQNRGQMVRTRIQESLFAFENVPPGSYIVNAVPYKNGDNGQSSTLTAHYPVTVGDADVAGLEIVLSAGAEIPGVILLDGEPFTPEVGVVLQAQKGIGNSAAQAKDGTFTLHDVARAFYDVKINGGLDGYYVKSIRLDGRDLPLHECDLTSGAGGRLGSAPVGKARACDYWLGDEHQRKSSAGGRCKPLGQRRPRNLHRSHPLRRPVHDKESPSR